MSADGNDKRDSNGSISTSGTVCYSPYHAKTNYALDTVKYNHAKFLYELARRRLVLGSNLNLTPTDYNGDTYYGVTIGELMKRRIINDVSVLYNNSMVPYFSGTIDMNTIDHKGYMVLGVYFHLLADTYCHRATVPLTMAFQSADSTQKWSSMVYGSSYTVSKIAGSHISNASGLLTAIQNANGMPMIRLKDYLVAYNIDITYNGISYNVTPAGAYEDDPFFYSNRYSVSVSATSSKLTSIWNDTGDTNTYNFSTYSTVPLSSWVQ